MAVRRPAAKKPPGEASGLPSGDDRLLVEAAKKDPSRFAELYELNFARVYGYIARRVGDRDAAQDLTSDVFHKALASIHSFEWRGVPFAGMAAADCRQHDRRPVKTRRERDHRTGSFPIFPTWARGPSWRKPMSARACFGLVDQLPADQRRVIGMRFAEEKSIREIAQALGRTEGAVKQLAVPRLAELAFPHGGCQCLSALCRIARCPRA